MPEISRFYGIVIRMFHQDHGPPHFHAYYGEYQAVIAVETMAVLNGDLPSRALGLVVEWASIHREELLRDWEYTRLNKPLCPIDPLS